MSRLKQMIHDIGSVKVRDDVNGHHIDLEFKDLIWLVGVAGIVVALIHLTIFMVEMFL